MKTKWCSKCSKVLPLKEFSVDNRKGLRIPVKPHCKKCRNVDGKTYNLSLKMSVFNAYGGPICVCCGEAHVTMLTIDHINGGGTMQRKQLKLTAGQPTYRWLKDNNYPLGFQVMCFNCNASKHIYGGVCEHATVEHS